MAARARIEEMNQQIAEHRELEHALRRAVLDSEERAREMERAMADRPGSLPSTPVVAAEPASGDEPRVERDEPRDEPPQPVGAGVGSATGTPPPSDLRRAVFASLTELAGDS